MRQLDKGKGFSVDSPGEGYEKQDYAHECPSDDSKKTVFRRFDQPHQGSAQGFVAKHVSDAATGYDEHWNPASHTIPRHHIQVGSKEESDRAENPRHSQLGMPLFTSGYPENHG